MKKKKNHRVLKMILSILAVLLIVVIAYVAYVFIAYSRISDGQVLDVRNGNANTLNTEQEYSIMTWNLGFGAYSDDYTFFMDGGTESWAFSPDAVRENIGGATARLLTENPDFMLLQEIDYDATRSYHIDERELIYNAFPNASSVFAVNYDSPFLFYPITQPHGTSRAGLLSLSNAGISSAIRRSLPIEESFMKLVDLDRCYSIARIPVANGKELCLCNLHLSAYTSDGTIATEQLKMLTTELQKEYEQGNYIVAGGDFNKDLLGNSGERFGVSGEAYTWAQPIDESLIPEGISLIKAFDEENPVPSCRNCDIPYIKGETFVVTVDGFLVSDNIEVLNAEVLDEGFAHTDHNPVKMIFKLKNE